MFKSVFKSGIRSTYNVSENASFRTELWAVYPAKHRQSGKAASVFIFDKTKFESQVQRLCSLSPNTRNPRLIINECYDLIKNEVSKLTKLKHPQVLTVLEVVEETKLKFIFAAEPVVANLVTLDLTKEDELSIQKGLLEVSKGLQFLHNFCSTIHLNLQPASVFVNSQGDWKLAGFRFLQNLSEMSVLERENFYLLNNSSIVPFANHNLNFTAPELVIDTTNQRLDTANDLWSLGLLIYYVYNKGDHLISCYDSSSSSDFKSEFSKFERKFYNHRPSELKYLLKEVPESLWPTMTQLLARYPNDRISIDAFIDSEFFNGSLIKTMWFIDEYSTKTMQEKLIFLSGLISEEGAVLKKLPIAFKNSKLLPLLLENTTTELKLLSSKRLDPDMDDLISRAFKVVMLIGENLSGLSFQDRVYSTLLDPEKKRKEEASPLMKLAKVSVKCRIEIVDHIHILVKKSLQKQVTDLVREIASLCLTYAPNETDAQEDQIKLQEGFLKNLELVAEMFDFPYIKNTLFPLICQVFKTTTILSTKLQTITTFQMLIDKNVIDRVIVNEQLLPVVENLKSRDKRIVSAILIFFTRISQSEHIALDLESLVDKVLVQCIRLSFGCTGCSKTEFQEFMTSVEKIQSTLKDRKAQTLDSIQEPSSRNFDSLINTPLLRLTNKDDNVKGPQLKPMAPIQKATNSHSTSRAPHRTNSAQSKPTPQVRRLELKPTPKAPLSFGAVGIETNVLNKTVAASPREQDKFEDEEFEDFQDGSTPHRDTSLDWTSAKALNSPISTQLGSTMQPRLGDMNLQSVQGNSSGIPASRVKYPPGYSASVVLTPNSTGSAPAKGPAVAVAPQTSQDLLDFL